MIDPPPRPAPSAKAVFEDTMRMASQMDDDTLVQLTRELKEYLRRRDAGEEIDLAKYFRGLLN